MQAYDNEMRGVLFRNDKRETDKHPEYTGKVQIRGEEFRLAAWVRESSKSGQKFFSIAVSEPQNTQAEPGSHEPDLDDSVPF